MTLQEFLAAVGKTEADLPKPLTHEEVLSAVRQNGWALRYVRDQTPEICLAAVRQDGLALQYVDIRIFDEQDKQDNPTTQESQS